MDIHERKIKRSEWIGSRYPEKITERAIEERLRKLKDFGNLEVAYYKVIGYSDIDFNGHFNNSKYVDYMMACFPVEEHKNHTLHTIDLNFNQEALPFDSITLYKDISRVDENSIYIEGISGNDNNVVFNSLVTVV